jgi:hypothetical protein
MSAKTDLEFWEKYAWNSSHKRKQQENAPIMTRVEITPTKGIIKFQPRNYCDDDLSAIFEPPNEIFKDNWWKFA